MQEATAAPMNLVCSYSVASPQPQAAYSINQHCQLFDTAVQHSWPYIASQLIDVQGSCRERCRQLQAAHLVQRAGIHVEGMLLLRQLQRQAIIKLPGRLEVLGSILGQILRFHSCSSASFLCMVA